MRDVALVPQRDVLERGVRVRAQQPRQPDDLFAADRVALVRHRRRTLLALAEWLLDLADLRLLKSPHFERELFERCPGNRHHRQQFGMPVALDDLGGDWRRLETELPADGGFDVGRQVCERSDRTRQLADADRRARAPYP